MPSEISFQEAWGTFLHDTLLPALWKEFGLPNDCSSIPIHCHSLGTPEACVAAALHADEASSAYPLAGITISGFGNGVSNFRVSMDPFLPSGEPASIPFPNDMKDALMLVPGTHEPSMLKHTARLNRPVPYREMADLSSKWLATWQVKFAGRIRVPVLIALAGRDGLWLSNEEDVQEFTASFTASRRVEAGIVAGAPHNLELSYWSRGWYACVFGFALEAAVALAVGNT